MTPMTTLEQEVGVKAARKLRARRNSAQGVWFGSGDDGAGRLVGCNSDAAWRCAGHLARPSLSGQTRLDAGAAGGRTWYRLPECLALGGQGRQ